MSILRVDASQFIVCLGYNDTYDYFQPAFFALMQSKSEEAYTRLHQAVRNISNDRFNPIKFTLDFEKAHINVNKGFFLKNIYECFKKLGHQKNTP